MAPRPRVGLVFGGGANMAIAYSLGALEAIRRGTGWQPTDADVIVGTSAGSFLGAVLAGGVPAADLHGGLLAEEPAPSRPDPTDWWGALGPSSFLPRFTRWPPALPRPALSSPALVRRNVGRGANPFLLFTGAVGDGAVPSRVVGEVLMRFLPRGHTVVPFWTTSVNMDTGERAVLGSPGAPPTDVERRVRASCAWPGIVAPVMVGGHRHVDGGLWSSSHVDVLAGEGLDLVVVVNVTAGPDPARRLPGWGKPLAHLARLGDNWMRRQMRRAQEQERAVVEASGTPVLVLEPSREDLETLPLNFANRRSRGDVARRGELTTTGVLASKPHGAAAARILTASKTRSGESRSG